MEEDIKYELSVSVREDILEIVFTGEITESALGRLHDDVISVVKGKEIRAILCDIRTLKGRFEDYGAAFFRSQSLPPELRRLPSAVVDVSENEAYQSFYVTTAANVGHSIKWFTDVESARVWLKANL